MEVYVAQEDMTFLNGSDGKGLDGVAQDHEKYSISFKKGDKVDLEAVLKEMPPLIAEQINKAVEEGKFIKTEL